MRPPWFLLLAPLFACAAPGKTPWTFDPVSTTRLSHPIAEPAAGGPLVDEPSEPVLGSYEAEPDDETLDAAVEPPGARELLLLWPLATTGITSTFGPRDDPFDRSRRYHYGVDLEAAYGAVVSSSARGRVVFTGWNQGHGRQVVVTHAGGYQTGYSHLAQVLIMEGAHVEPGQPLGFVGTSGRSTGPHLHFEITRWGEHLDPLNLLGIPLVVE